MNLELVQLLVDKGAQTNHQSSEGKTALQIAEEEGHEGVAAYLKGNR